MSDTTIQRIRIYITENDMWDKQPLYLAMLKLLQREGASGATVLTGIRGFGPRQRMRTADFVLSDHQPIVLEWIDQPAAIERIMPRLNEMLSNTLVTIEDVQPYTPMLRSQGPFTGERSAGDVMQKAPATITPAERLGKALALMLSRRQTTLPVLNEQGRMVGVLADQELQRRIGLALPMRLLYLLNDAEGQAIFGELVQMPVSEVMNADPRSIYTGAGLPQALIVMVEWNYDQVAVVDREGLFAGLLSSEDVLRAAVARHSESGELHETMVPTSVQMIMQGVAPSVQVDQPLAAGLHQLLRTPFRYLIVVDDERHVQGYISDSSILQRLSGDERAAFLAALHKPDGVTIEDLPGAASTVRQVLEREMPVFKPNDNILEAGRRLLELRLERAPVLDAEGRLNGMLTRSGLLRALIQEGQ